ncbi:MAG: GDSL-type esterase/lipase family protein [Dysgonamonadaceae bacterium]|jgi:lysophospholipase L1-like esterase|nr:GDSL-type esterase/lipase family protein [Dysgonamonadaceae bacterium]
MKPIRFILLLAWCFTGLAVTPTDAQERWRKDIEAFITKDTENGVHTNGILFVGSSTFNLWRNLPDYFPGYAITNRGFGGSSMRDVLYFYEHLVKPHKPAQLFLYEGDNDLANDHYTVDEFITDVKCFIHLTHVCFPKCEIYILSIKPSPARQKFFGKYAEANARMKELCDQTPNLRFIDMWSLMADPEGQPAGTTDYFLEDRLHLNVAGYNRWAEVIRPYLKQQEATPATVVFMGNSITEAWAENRPAFFKDNNYLGRGISGQTAPQMLSRFRSDVVALKPQVVVINGGINDIATNSGPYDFEFTLGSIQSMAEIARANGIKVILTSVLPASGIPWRKEIPAVPAKVNQLNAAIKTYCAEKNFTYVDYYSQMVSNDSSKGMIEQYTTDGVHVTVPGYEVMEKIVKQAIDSLIKK